MLVIALAGIWLISSPALRNMVATWSGSPEFSHAPLIPLISAFLVWQQKDVLERIEFGGSWAGVLLALFGALLAVAGVLASLFPVSQYGAVFAVYGVVLAGVGLRVFRRLWAPLLILLLMVPLPDFLLNNLSAEMQLISSAIGVWFMRLFGVSVYLEGNVIDLGVLQAAGGRGLRRPALPVPADDARLHHGLFLQGRDVEAGAALPLQHPDHDPDEQPARRHHRRHGRALGHRHGRGLPARLPGLGRVHAECGL